MLDILKHYSDPGGGTHGTLLMRLGLCNYQCYKLPNAPKSGFLMKSIFSQLFQVFWSGHHHFLPRRGFCIESLKILMCVGPCLSVCSLLLCHTFFWTIFGTLHVLPSKQFRVFWSKKGSKVWHLAKLHGFDHQKNCFEGSKRRVQKGIVLGETWIWLICYSFSSWRVWHIRRRHGPTHQGNSS